MLKKMKTYANSILVFGLITLFSIFYVASFVHLEQSINNGSSAKLIEKQQRIN